MERKIKKRNERCVKSVLKEIGKASISFQAHLLLLGYNENYLRKLFNAPR